VDLSGAKIKKARMLAPAIKFKVADVFAKLKLVRQASVIVSFQTFEHLGTRGGDEDIQLIRTVSEGTRVIFSVPNSPTVSGSHLRWFGLDGWRKRYQPWLNFKRYLIRQDKISWQDYLFEGVRNDEE
jgi:hypothetical protein